MNLGLTKVFEAGGGHRPKVNPRQCHFQSGTRSGRTPGDTDNGCRPSVDEAAEGGLVEAKRLRKAGQTRLSWTQWGGELGQDQN
jgi:hypothetical protein